jgi:hypothetical protein
MTFAKARVADMRPIRWLGDLAETMARAIGEAQDDEVDKLKAAASFGSPEHCPDDAIARLAEIFRMPTFAGFTDEQLRALCTEAFSTWEEIGLPQAIVRALTLYGIPEIEVFNYADWPTPDQWFSKFWVRIAGMFLPLLWGSFSWGGSSTWGSTATATEIRITSKLIVFCKSPQSLPVSVVVDFGDGFLWGVHPWGSSAWGGTSIQWPLANLWGAEWAKWGAFKWGTGRWITGEL